MSLRSLERTPPTRATHRINNLINIIPLIQKMDYLRYEKTRFIDLFKHPIFYFLGKNQLNQCIKLIQSIDKLFVPPKIYIRFTFIKGKSGGMKHEKGRFILKLNPVEKNTWRLKRIVLHELIHLWIGKDSGIGLSIMPIKVITPREKLVFFLNKYNKKRNTINFNHKTGNIINKNIYETFEENLVNYTMMKILGDSLENYPDLKCSYENKFDDAKILSFADKKMPHVIDAINYLVSEYQL